VPTADDKRIRDLGRQSQALQQLIDEAQRLHREIDAQIRALREESRVCDGDAAGSPKSQR